MHGKHEDHGHGHSHSDRFGYAFAIGIGLNIALVALQIIAGFWSNSVALLADAGHNFGDVVGLVLAWMASVASARPPTLRYTYGMRSSSILAALANAIILLISVGAIALEAVRRFGSPEPVAANAVIIVAALGILISGGTALLFVSGRKGDLNIQGAFLHMAADAGLSFGVLLSGFIILRTGWVWLDPLVSLVIASIIVWSTWGVLRDSVRLALDAVPPGVDPIEVRRDLERLPGVEGIHDLHIWALSTTETALTCHLVMPSGHPGDAFIAQVARNLQAKFKIHHSTVQVECGDAEACVLAPDHVV